MPSSSSQLRQSSPPTSAACSPVVRPTAAPAHKKQKMTLTQTYYLAHTARAKLSREASKSDHDLRLLVGHANLLDGLMLDLAEAEREQEHWFNATVTKAAEEPKHIRFVDSLPPVVEDYETDSDSDGEDEEEEIEYSPPPLRRVLSPPMTITTTEIDMDEDDEDDYYYDEDDDDESESLQLTRTRSHTSVRSPPELLHESDSESEDDSMPPSPPPQPLDVFSAKQRQATLSSKPPSTAISLSSAQEDAFDESYYLPQRQAIAVY